MHFMNEGMNEQLVVETMGWESRLSQLGFLHCTPYELSVGLFSDDT